MVSRSALTRKPQKKPKKTKSEVYLSNLRHLGKEPSKYGPELSMSEKARVLAWYSYMADVGDAREYAEEYLTAAGRDDLLPALATVADTSFPITPSWLARMSTMGAPTTPETHAFVLSAFETAVRKYAGRAVDPIDIAAARVE